MLFNFIVTCLNYKLFYKLFFIILIFLNYVNLNYDWLLMNFYFFFSKKYINFFFEFNNSIYSYHFKFELCEILIQNFVD